MLSQKVMEDIEEIHIQYSISIGNYQTGYDDLKNYIFSRIVLKCISSLI